MNNNLLLSLTESIISRDFCVATYYVSLPPGSDPYEKAKNMAVGQTIGTWIPVPGITEEMRQNYRLTESINTIAGNSPPVNT